MSYLKYQGKLYKRIEGAFTARQSDVDSRLNVDAEIKDLKIKLGMIEAHNLELTQALKHTSDTANRDRDPFRSCSMICEYVYKQLSSPASRKYLAMIEVVEAAKKWEKQSQYGCPEAVVLEDAVRILESEEANEGD